MSFFQYSLDVKIAGTDFTSFLTACCFYKLLLGPAHVSQIVGL